MWFSKKFKLKVFIELLKNVVTVFNILITKVKNYHIEYFIQVGMRKIFFENKIPEKL